MSHRSYDSIRVRLRYQDAELLAEILEEGLGEGPHVTSDERAAVARMLASINRAVETTH